MSVTVSSSPLLSVADWREQQRAHAARVDALIGGHRERAARGEPHPVEDFLFSYYSFRAGALRRWHPGPNVELAGAEAQEFLRWPEYRATADGVELQLARIHEKRRKFARWLASYLAATAERTAFFGCFGWHEWAMVYRQSATEIRHRKYPMRFSTEALAEIVEAGPSCCSHFDAFRFFTPAARPLNRLQPTRETTKDFEQPGCLHANMDLYKWAFKLSPATPGALLLNCFELAREIREIDMRASPYDLRGLGYEPIKVETVEGRAEYEHLQRGFAQRGKPLREQLRALAMRISEA
jgi:hypothetical protein